MEVLQQLTRTEKRQQKKQRRKVTKIIKRFLKMYDVEVAQAQQANERRKKDISDGVVCPIGLGGQPIEKEAKEDHERQLSDVNNIYLESWRRMLKHFEANFPLSKTDPNYFNQFIIWE